MTEKDPTVIAVSGMKRSGTTTQFNIIRCALTVAGYDVWAGGPAPDALGAIDEGDHDVYVVKEHRWRYELAKECHYVFTSDRDREEVKRSMEDFRGFRPDAETMEEWEGWLEEWRDCSAFVRYHMPFWTLEKYPRAVLQSHLHVLNVDVDVDEVAACVAESMRPPEEERQDGNTLIFKDHYTSRDPSALAQRFKSQD